MKGERASIDLLIPQFYKLLNRKDSWAYKPGQLYFTPVVYPQSYPTILKLEEYDPRDETSSKFSIKRYSSGDEKHYPVPLYFLLSPDILRNI